MGIIGPSRKKTITVEKAELFGIVTCKHFAETIKKIGNIVNFMLELPLKFYIQNVTTI